MDAIMLEEFHRLLSHAEWADRVLLQALQATAAVPPDAIREYAHVFGAAETWLSRLEARPSRAAVWPALSLADAGALAREVHAGYAACLAALDEPALKRRVSYTNSAGQSFETQVDDILMHVALHAQYHRGKINLLLRQAGLSPAPTDYIAFVRGAPAATTVPAGR